MFTNSLSGSQSRRFSETMNSNPFAVPSSSAAPNPFAIVGHNIASNPFGAPTHPPVSSQPGGFGMPIAASQPPALSGTLMSDVDMETEIEPTNSFDQGSRSTFPSVGFFSQQPSTSNAFVSTPFGASGDLMASNPFINAGSQPASSFSPQPAGCRSRITTDMVDSLLNAPSTKTAVVLYRAPAVIDPCLIESSRCHATINTDVFGSTSSGQDIHVIIQQKDLSTAYEEQQQFREIERARLIKEGVIDDPDKPKNLDQAQVFKGQCNNKCPSHEILQRVYQNAVDPLERDENKIPRAELFVKRYHRPAAGIPPPLPRDVRSPQALVATMDYMLHTLLEKYPLSEAHSFIRDRTRSVRQDFTFQDYRGKETVYAHELITRFHIVSLHRLGGQSSFEVYPEMEQLGKTLTTLDQRYMDNYRQHHYFDTEPEFRAYYIILNAQDKDVESRVARWPCHVQESKYVQLALHLRSLMESNTMRGNNLRAGKTEAVCDNAFAFFNIIASRKVPYLMASLLSVRFQEIRRNALNYLVSHSLRQQKYATLKWIKEKLAYESIAELEAELALYEFEVGISEAGERYLITKQSAYAEDTPASRKPRFHQKLVESKAYGRSIPEIISEGDHIDIVFHFRDDREVSAPSAAPERSVPKLLKAAVTRQPRGFRSLLSQQSLASIAPLATSARVADMNRMLAPAVHVPAVHLSFSKQPQLFKPTSSITQNPPSFTRNSLTASSSFFPSAPPAVQPPAVQPPVVQPPAVQPPAVQPPAAQPPASVLSQHTSGAPQRDLQSASLTNPFARTSSPSWPLHNSPSNPFTQNPVSDAAPTPMNPFPKPIEDYKTPVSGHTQPSPGLSYSAPIISSGSIFNPFAPNVTLNSNAITGDVSQSFPPFLAAPLSFTPVVAASDPALAPSPVQSLQFTPPAPVTMAVPPTEAPVLEPSVKPTLDSTKEPTPEPFERTTTPESSPPPAGLQDAGISGGTTSSEIPEEDTFDERGQIADQQYQRNLLQKTFSPWMKCAISKMKRRDGIMRRRQPKKKLDVQWWPVDRMQINDDMLQDAMHHVMKPVDIQAIFTKSVEAKYERAGLRNSIYRVFCPLNDDTGDGYYWWEQKLLAGESKVSYKLANGNTIVVQSTCSTDELPTVGSVVFGCALPNGNPSLNSDRAALHELTRRLVENGVRDTFAIMVVCFRAPGDCDDADPIHITPRTTKKGREHRLDAIFHALALEKLDPRITFKEVILVETMADVDLTAPLKRLADYEARIASPKRRLEKAKVATPEPPRRVKARIVAKSKASASSSFLDKLRAAPRRTPPNGRPKPTILESERQAENYLMCQTRNLVPVQAKTGPRAADTRQLALRAKEEGRKKELAAIVAQQTKEYEELHRFSVAVLTEARGQEPAGKDVSAER